MLRQSIERIVWIQLLLCTLSALAKAPIPIEAPPIIPRSVLFGEDDDDKSNVRLSPDGTMLGYCAPHEGVMNIWIQPLDQVLDGRKTAKPVTFDKKRGIRSFSWTYLPGLILFGQDNDGDENLRLWKLNVTGVVNEPVVVSDTPGVQARLRAVSPKHPETIILALNDRDKRYHDLYTVDLLTGEKKLCFENPDYRSFVFDNDMKLRLATKENEEGAVEFFKAIYADGIIASWESYRNITFEDKDTTRVVGFDKESKNLYWIDADGYDLGTLIVHPFEDPSKKTEIFTPQKAEISTPFVHPVDYTVLAVTENYKRSHTYIINKTIEADFSYLRSQEQVDDIFVHQVSEDFDKWIVLYNFDNAPAKYYFYDRKAQQATFLFVNRPKLIDLKLSRMHAVEIVTRDELTQLCYLSLPVESDPFEVGLPQEPLPMVLSVHGGPWMRDYWGMLRGVQHFTNRGYAVLQCNYRGSAGFGKKFLNAGNGEWAGKMHDDLIDAVVWAIDNKIAIPNKIAIEGASYGGYAALVGLTFTPDVFACGIDMVGPSNLLTLLETIPPYWKPMFHSFVKRIGGDPTTPEGRKFLKERSPLTYAKQVSKPLLIAQGANDPRVKKSESDQFYEALKEKNISATYLIYPDEGHGFQRPQNQMSYTALAEKFLSECLGGRFEPITNEKEKSTVEIIEHKAE